MYNWAAENPQSVACIAGIYPVCNLNSYPGLARACGAYGMSKEQLAANLAEHNPIDRLASLAKAKVPIFHIHGDRDDVVPLDRNSGELVQRYSKLGAKMTLKVVKGQGHKHVVRVVSGPRAGQFRNLPCRKEKLLTERISTKAIGRTIA